MASPRTINLRGVKNPIAKRNDSGKERIIRARAQTAIITVKRATATGIAALDHPIGKEKIIAMKEQNVNQGLLHLELRSMTSTVSNDVLNFE